MADIVLQKRTATPSPVNDPTYSSALGVGSFCDEDNDYAKLKKLQRHLEYVIGIRVYFPERK